MFQPPLNTTPREQLQSSIQEIIRDIETPSPRWQPQVEDDDVIELDEEFDFDGFQVVRREFFAHMSEPSVTFNNYKFNVNAACINKFPDFEYAQVLINRSKKILALRPCDEYAKDAFMWCSIPASGKQKGKRKPKATTCKLFFAKIISLMEWNPDYRYKILGKVVKANDEILLVFDLTATEVYKKEIREGEKTKTSRTPIFPAEWQNQFGMPYNEHRQALQIDVFQDYAVYAIKGNNGEDASPEQKATNSESTEGEKYDNYTVE